MAQHDRNIQVVGLTFSLYCQVNPNHVWVKGSWNNGVYKKGYYRTAPNSTVNDNFSTLGNRNPYTGEMGNIPRQEDSYGKFYLDLRKTEISTRVFEELESYNYLESIEFSPRNPDFDVTKKKVRASYTGHDGEIYKGDGFIETIKVSDQYFEFSFSRYPTEFYRIDYLSNNVDTRRKGDIITILHSLGKGAFFYIVYDLNIGVVHTNTVIRNFEGPDFFITDVFNSSYTLIKQSSVIHWLF